MLEGLDSVDWAKLRHAYGWATGTPCDIRRLIDPDPQVRDHAFDQLGMSIVHQTSLCPAAAAAVPFLAEIVASPETPDKALVLGLLAELARGEVCPFEQIEEYGDHVSPEGYLDDGSGPWGPPLLRLVRERLAEGVATYIELLEDPEPRTRLQVTDLLFELPEHVGMTAPALVRRLETETDETVRANAIWVLHRLAGKDYTDLFARLAEEERPGLSGLAALGACVALLGPAAPGAAPEELLLAVQALDPDLVGRYNALPSTCEFLYDLALPLAGLSAEYATTLLPSMVEACETGVSRGRDAQEALLTVALPEGASGTSTGLTNLQRRAIRAVALHAFPEPAWTVGNVANILMRHGLPGRFEEMEQFLGEPLHKPKPWWRFC